MSNMDIRISKPQCYSAIGKKPNQEDALYPRRGKATKDTHVFLVCDGMGGHENGEVASACVADTIGTLTSSLPRCTTDEMRLAFEDALSRAYQHLDELDNVESEKKMGTTLTFLALCADGVLVAHIGDSRVYQLRPGKGIVFQTRDHSLVNDLVASGEISEEEAQTHPQRNVITRAIQPHQEYPAKPAYTVLTDVRRGDVFFLCCDGVVEQLDNKDLCTYLLEDDPVDERLAQIEQECKARGTRDNNTAYLIEVKEVGGTDTVTVESVESDGSLQRVPVKGKGNMTRNMIFILASIILGILALIFLLAPPATDTKETQKQSVPNREQVQGTITRHRK